MRGWFIRALSEELSSAHREDCLNLERCSKNLMAILRDVVMRYDGTVRNVCSNPITQSEYGVKAGTKSQSLFLASEPVGL